MGQYKYILNKRTGQFNLVPTNTVIAFKAGVANEVALPSSGNEIGDGIITQNNHHLHVWDGSDWQDQGDIIDLIASVITTDETGLTVQDALDSLEEEKTNKFLYVKNNSGDDLSPGQVVYISGTPSSGIPKVKLAKADSLDTIPAVAIVVTSITKNEEGYVQKMGTVSNINTSNLSEGETVYLSADVAGELTKTKPTNPNYIQRLGACLYKHGTSGIIEFEIDTAIYADTKTVAQHEIDSDHSKLHTQNTDTILASAVESLDISNIPTSLQTDNVSGDTWLAQTFTAIRKGTLTKLVLMVSKDEGITQDFVVEIQEITDGKPNGSILATKSILASAVPTGEENMAEVEVVFSSPASIINGTVYAVVVHSTTIGNYEVGSKGGALYSGGSEYVSSDGGYTWGIVNNVDFYFKVYITTPSGGCIDNTLLNNDLIVANGKKIDGRDISVDGDELDDVSSKKHEAHSDDQNASQVETNETGKTVQDKLDDLEVDSHTHSNKSDLDLVSGTNTGDQDLSELQEKSEKGNANGYASLDGGGKIPVTQLPNAIMSYLGTWNANTNSPALTDGMTGATAGDVYRVSVAGTQNLGSGAISFEVGDYCIYNGSTWEKADTTDAVSQINGKLGEVNLVASDIPTDETGKTTQDKLDELDSGKEPANANIQNHISSTSDPHKEKRFVIFKVLADDEVLTTGDGKFRFVIPTVMNGMNLIETHAHIYTVSSSGLPQVAVYNETQGADMLSVNITIDVNENDSKNAETQPTIDGNNDDVANGDVIRVDVDAAGTGTKGLEIRLTFQLPA